MSRLFDMGTESESAIVKRIDAAIQQALDKGNVEKKKEAFSDDEATVISNPKNRIGPPSKETSPNTSLFREEDLSKRRPSLGGVALYQTLLVVVTFLLVLTLFFLVRRHSH